MKKKLIACALVLTLFGCAKDTDFKKKEVKQLVNLISEEERSEIVQMIRRFNSLTEEEKTTVVNVTLDDYSFNHGSSERFDRSIKEPVFTKEALKKRTLHLEKLLDECLDVINVDPNKHKNSVYFYYYEMGRYGEKSERSQLYGRAQPSYLTGRVKQCTDYLYSENYDIVGE